MKRNISLRDKIINDRREAGHVEVDTNHLAGQGCILTVVDRMYRYLSARLLPNRKKETIKKALFEIIHEWKRACKILTITSDNGTEFNCLKDIREIEDRYGIRYYHCDPYAIPMLNPNTSWQRGSSENINRMVRRFFPKKTHYNAVSKQALEEAIKMINYAPRKILNHFSAYELFFSKSVRLLT